MNTLIKEPIRPLIESGSRSRPALKLVTAVIRPERLGAVTEALIQLDLGGGFTVSEVRGSGRFATMTQWHRGIPFVVRMACELKIEAVVPEDRVHEIMESIRQHARTGNVGDGKIWVTDVATVIRIRTGECGLAAL
jgi:nitrogen regulatory protein PII